MPAAIHTPLLSLFKGAYPAVRCLPHAVAVNYLTEMEVSGLGVHPDFKGRE